jgi:hypothetical protein
LTVIDYPALVVALADMSLLLLRFRAFSSSLEASLNEEEDEEEDAEEADDPEEESDGDEDDDVVENEFFIFFCNNCR